ncbi:MAG: hypothetical protein HYT75_06075 [Deltaproteobacteria bacterium]|nr:hypothetical protein [Deltaproteobacteria bacterium]
MKKILALAVILSVATVACDAFKDNYGNEPKKTAGAAAPGVGTTPAGGGGSGTVNAIDYASDKTECVAVEGVKVVKAEDADAVKATVLNVAEEGAELKTTAEKVGAFTTKISSLAADKELLSLTLKQTAEKEFAVCAVSYNGLKVKSGEVTVAKFNDGADKDAAKAVNSGSFKFEFEDAGTAASAIKELLTEKAADATLVEGTYLAEGLTEKAKEEEKK